MTTDDVTLIDCPRCGGPNHPARRTCGRCRAPVVDTPVDRLDDTVATTAAVVAEVHDTDPSVRVDAARASTGQRVVDLLRGTTPGDTQPLDPVTVPPIESERIRARPVLSVTVAGLALGAIVGAVVAFGLPNSATAPAEPTRVAVNFDPDAYDEPPTQTRISGVTASSFLPATGEDSYAPALLLDENVATAWNSDGSIRVDGLGEVLRITLSEPTWVTALELANGYQKDDVRFLANARVARATLVVDGGLRLSVVLIDQNGFQRIPLSEPLLTTSLRIEVTEVFAGDTYDDLAISELRLFGYSAVGDDRTQAVEVADQNAAA